MLQFLEVGITQAKYLTILVRCLGLIFKCFKHILELVQKLCIDNALELMQNS